MNSIFSFVKGVIFWIFVLGFISGAYLGGSFMSYFGYVHDAEHASELNTPQYKVQYNHNIFYRLDKWSNPDGFRDVLKLEKEKRLKEFKENEEEIENDNKDIN